MRLSSLAALAALLVLTAITTSKAHANIIWTAGHESGGTEEWTAGGQGDDNVNTGTGSGSVSGDVAHSGSRSLKMTITGSGYNAVRFFRWGSELDQKDAYFSAYYYFPQNYNGMSWWNVMQWKSRSLTNNSNDPAWVVNVGTMADGRMRFFLWNHLAGRGYDQYSTAVPASKWVHLEVFYCQATDNTGRITVFQDGVQILDAPNVQTRRPNDDLYWGLSNYTDRINPSPATVYVDDAAVSTTRLGPAEAPAKASAAAPAGAPSYRLGFAVLAGILGGQAGDPMEDESHDPASGDGLQRTTTGLMVWRKADNWTAFTDGDTSWINGPYGLQQRGNGDRFPWEKQ